MYSVMPKLLTGPEDTYQRVKLYKHDVAPLSPDIEARAYWVEFAADGRLIDHDIPDPVAAELLFELALTFYHENACLQWRVERADLEAGQARGWGYKDVLFLPPYLSTRELVKRFKAIAGWTGKRCKVYRQDYTFEIHLTGKPQILRVTQHE